MTGLCAMESREEGSSKEHSNVALKLYSVNNVSVFASTFVDSPSKTLPNSTRTKELTDSPFDPFYGTTEKILCSLL